jgi:hypothetical protein
VFGIAQVNQVSSINNPPLITIDPKTWFCDHGTFSYEMSYCYDMLMIFFAGMMLLDPNVI